ncbi:hypothetical protein OEZ86_008867 [Tetradesmus obliquus]|nr:hypothetical protein OEZ86_008867 [Tetradesmus obliquus]
MGFGKLIQRKLLAAPGSEAKQQREDLGGQSDQDDDSLLPAGLDPAAGASSSYAGCSELSGDGRSMHSSSGSSSSGASSDSGREDEVEAAAAAVAALAMSPAADPTQQPTPSSSCAALEACWSARVLACCPSLAAAAPRLLPLATPTSASLDFWEAHQGDSLLFNVGLVSSSSSDGSSDGGIQQQRPVPINALDLAANSEWFRALVAHLPVLCGTDLGAVAVPCAVAREVLEHGIVRAIYGSRLALDPGTVEATYRAADAMQIPAIVDACEAYLFDLATGADAESAATLAVFDLAVDLHRSSLAHKLAAHYAAAAQRDAAAAGPLLRHMLSSACFAGCGLSQLAVLRAGFEAAWAGGQGPEVLLLHVLLEVYEALNPRDYGAVLDALCWEVLQQEEVLMLAHWCGQLPQQHAFTHGLQARVLARVAQQLSGRHERRYIVWKLEVGQLPGNGQRVASSQCLRLRHRRLYLVAEHMGDADWGLFLCPAPDVSLASRVAGHTLFVLGRELHKRVGFKDCVVPPDTRIGVGFGDRTALSEWMGAGYVQSLGDGSKHVVVGTIVTDVPCSEAAESAGLR